MVQMSKTLLKRGHKVTLLTTNFNIKRVEQITEYHRSKPHWDFTLTTCEDDKLSREDFMGEKAGNKMFLPGSEKWAWLAINHVTSRTNKFDVVVSDIMTSAGTLIADQFKVPLVVNVPYTLRVFQSLSD